MLSPPIAAAPWPRAHEARALSAIVAALFFVSGFAALVYQVAWQRMFVLFAGGDIHSVTVIVAAFMGGLGLGNLAAGARVDRHSQVRALALFGAAEGVVALIGFFSKHLYYDALYHGFGAGFAGRSSAGLVLFAALLVPTFLMGLSLPLLARCLVSALSDAAPRIGTLYGVNTLGAALGALATTWVLLPLSGIEGAVRFAAWMNSACALAVLPLALALRRRRDIPGVTTASAPAPAIHATEAPWDSRTCLAVFALSGFIALALEIVWFRLLGVMLKSTSFTFGTLLAIYLAGVGLGALIGARLARHHQRPATTFLRLQGGISILALALPALLLTITHGGALGGLRSYLDSYEPIDANTAVTLLQAWWSGTADAEVASRWWLFPVLHFALPLLIVGPPTLLMGVSFPFLQKAAHGDLARIGLRVGSLQAANIAGSVAGTVLTSLVALPVLGTAATLRGLAIGGVIFLAIAERRHALALPHARLWLPALLLAGVSLAPNQRELWAHVHGSTTARIELSEDGSGVSLLKSGETGEATTVFVNGIGQSWIPFGGIHTLLGALPALLHPMPEEIAVIGLGSGDTVFSAAVRAETRRVECIEIIGAQRETLDAHVSSRGYPALRSLLRDPRVQHITGDGRTHLMATARRYDIIEADALRPTSSHAGNLYSLEYFALLRSRLKPGGFAVTWCPTPRVAATFVRAFPHVLILGPIAIGSDAPIPTEATLLQQRAQSPEVRAYFSDAGVRIDQLLDAFLKQIGSPLSLGSSFDRTTLRDVNTDLFPRDEFELPALWGAAP